jgi:signal transduction histidine kinase
VTPGLTALSEAYATALRDYLEHGGEAPLFKAYQIGRSALAAGLGALEVAAVHQEALVKDLLQMLAPEASSETARRAAAFFAEALAPFEANRRGFEEATGVLRGLNQNLERRVEDAVDAYRSARLELDEKRRLESLKDEFVSLVSHELRTPLTAIHGSLGIIITKFGQRLPEEVTRLLEVASRNSHRLRRLIDNILDLEKAESGVLGFDIRTLPLRPMLEQAIDVNQPYAAHFGVQLKLEEVTPGLQVRADGERLMQVLTNLLSNASKFSPAGQTVAVAAQRRGTDVRITVTDRGPGIDEGFRDRVFQRFAQADATAGTPKEGTGLGLSIAKAMVERMQGSIGFDSVPGAGTTFYFDLPAQPAAPAEGATWLGDR